MPKIALFDADGVLTLPEEIFSVVYTRSRGLDYAPFETFFTTEWLDFVTGKRDLKQHIAEHPEFWQWDGMPDDLIRYWCEVEDVRNQPRVALIAQLRASGTRCYLATEQEKYRAEYMQTVMFPGLSTAILSPLTLDSAKTSQSFTSILSTSYAPTTRTSHQPTSRFSTTVSQKSTPPEQWGLTPSCTKMSRKWKHC